MILKATPIDGVMLAESLPYCDERGSFYRAYCTKDLKPIIGERQIAQINLSKTIAVGAVRGLHYQNAPKAEMKLIRCIRGKIWDVAVDLRSGSSTFLHWVAVELSPENYTMLVIPEGCAHGFQVMEKDSELLYLHTASYSPDLEGALRYDDPLISINWPLPVSDISERDMSHLYLNSSFSGLIV